MGGDTETIKDRLDIAEVISGYIKIEKAGTSYKACCPFHNEKTPSFFISPARQSYYCFGCGAKGDIFTFVEELEGLDFRGALKLLAEKAGVELEYKQGESKTEKDQVYNALESATLFFENSLTKSPEALNYLKTRGLNNESIKTWRLGFAPASWRELYTHLKAIGHKDEFIFKAGLVKRKDDKTEPYDVFRDRIIFPLFDVGGKVIAFSGRALGKETEPARPPEVSQSGAGGPKYLNSPDTILFTKSQVLYGLNRAKDEIRRKNYAVLVEGQMDLLLSHQVGISNTVASSGTAFTASHLERLKKFSPRIILAFDGDSAGEKASEKSALLGISLGLEVKIASLPKDSDPAEVVSKSPDEWKNILRNSLPAVEFFLNSIVEAEKDTRKVGKLIEQKVLPLISILGSAIEQSHFISLVSKRTGIKEEALWEDLKKTPKPVVVQGSGAKEDASPLENNHSEVAREEIKEPLTHREKIEERLKEIKLFIQELGESGKESKVLKEEESELLDNLASENLRGELNRLMAELSKKEREGDDVEIRRITGEIQALHGQIYSLEEKKKRL